MTTPISIAVLISGGGTTLKNLIDWRTRGELFANIKLVISSNRNAGGLDFAQQAEIATSIVDHRAFTNVEEFSGEIFGQLRAAEVQLVVMGGFLRRLKIPADFENRVVNIHPSLIPAFCGKGYYGSRVHEAVIDYGCKISGCTVHFVDDQYDHGPIIAQQSVEVRPDDTADSLAQRVFAQECELYPSVINAIATQQLQLNGRVVHLQ